MKYTAHLFDTTTKLYYWKKFEWDVPPDPDEPYEHYYLQNMWEEGNYSCGCNRGLFIGKELPCPDESVKVIKLVLEDGTELMIDG